MSHHDWTLAQLEDGELERQLLASAAQDAPPAGASERAFRELCADARALAALAALEPPRSAEPTRSNAPLPNAAPAAAARLPAAARSLSRAALLLVLGAVVGAGAVAAWRWSGTDAASLVPPLPPRRAAEPPVPALQPELAPAPLPSSPGGAPARASGVGVRAPERRASGDMSAERASRLAREVAALDAARASLAIGAGRGALRQIERYRSEFPQGELAADAEAVAIEALAVEGDHSALAAAARRFLARYPRDPHAARVRELAFIKQPPIEQPAPAP